MLHSSKQLPITLFLPINGLANGSGHQPPLSGHIWFKSFFVPGLGRALYQRPAADPQSRYHFNSSPRLPPFIKLLRQRRGEGNYMDLCVRLPSAPSSQNTAADLPQSAHLGEEGTHLGREGKGRFCGACDCLRCSFSKGF